MKDINIHYFVEGDDEKALLTTLKMQLKVIRPGKIQKLNVIEEKITDAMLRVFKSKTLVVLVFDTDTNHVGILKENIERLSSCSAVSTVVTIPQVPNLEQELIRSCNIKKITELFSSKSSKEFKADLLHITNLDAKLREHDFNIDLFWSQAPNAPYQDITNGADQIKLNGCF